MLYEQEAKGSIDEVCKKVQDASAANNFGVLAVIDLKEKITGLERVGIYANARDILLKEPEELKGLRKAGVGIIYLGLESGNREVLKRIKKNATIDQMIQAAKDPQLKMKLQNMPTPMDAEKGDVDRFVVGAGSMPGVPVIAHGLAVVGGHDQQRVVP
jgi:histone acetyltransferase (RNA polymerase elongator complex component)